MSEVERQLEALNRQLEAAQQHESVRDAVLRLRKNRDFQLVIEKIFMVEECARYAHTSADPAIPAENRADALAIAQAAGHLKRFLSVTIQMGDHATSQIPSIMETIDTVRGEEGED